MVKLPPLHPGEVLREEFLQPLGLTAYALAGKLGVPRTRIERIAQQATGITADTALRLGIFFGTTAEFWMNLQDRFEAARRAAGRSLDKIEARERACA